MGNPIHATIRLDEVLDIHQRGRTYDNSYQGILGIKTNTPNFVEFVSKTLPIKKQDLQSNKENQLPIPKRSASS